MKGDTVHLYWSVINNASGALVNPSSQTLKYIDPTGAQTNIANSSIVTDSTGNFHYDLSVTIPGMWWVRVETTTPNGESEYRFEVQGTLFS